MKAKAEDGRIEVEAEVDSNRSGQTWHWTLTPQRQPPPAAAPARRPARSGSFEVRRVTGNRAGTDTFVFVRTPTRHQQICRGTVRF